MGGVGGPNAGPAMLCRIIGDGEVAQVVASHLWLDFHLVEGLPIVHAQHAATLSGRMIVSRRSSPVGTSLPLPASPWAALPSWPCAGALAVSATSSAGWGSVASSWLCRAASVAHRTCQVS